MESALKSFLNKDPKRNISVLGFFDNYKPEQLFRKNDSLLILGKSDHLWAHIVSKDKDDLSFLLERYRKETKYYFSVEDWMIPLILKDCKVDWILTTHRYILKNNRAIIFSHSGGLKIDNSFAHFIHENSDYRDYTSIEYINDRLKRDISAGIKINDELVAWGFTHDDGALGFLHVLDAHRKKGHGIKVLSALISDRKKEGKPIFGNVLPNNHRSINLILKLGFEFDRKVSWIKLK